MEQIKTQNEMKKLALSAHSIKREGGEITSLIRLVAGKQEEYVYSPKNAKGGKRCSTKTKDN